MAQRCAQQSTSEKPRRLAPGTMVAIGQPLLDITTMVDDKFLRRHGLNYDDVLLACDETRDLLAELQKRTNIEYTAGGAAQNTLRVAQWILAGMPDRLSASDACTFYGAIGDDEHGERLLKAVQKDGLKVVLDTKKGIKTGICWVLICDAARLLLADLGAPHDLSNDHVRQHVNWSKISAARVIYLTAYCMMQEESLVLHLVEHAYNAGRTLVFNLTSVTLIEKHPDKFLHMLPYVDVLMGNCDEMMTMASLQGNFSESDDCADYARELANYRKMTDDDGRSAPEEAATGGRTVVVTQSEGDVLVIKRGWSGRFAVPKFQAYQVVDMNGVGDAFAGGFLAQMLAGMATAEGAAGVKGVATDTLGAPIEDCVRCGIWAAGQIMGRRGCSVGGPVEYDLCKCLANQLLI